MSFLQAPPNNLNIAEASGSTQFKLVMNFQFSSTPLEGAQPAIPQQLVITPVLAAEISGTSATPDLSSRHEDPVPILEKSIQPLPRTTSTAPNAPPASRISRPVDRLSPSPPSPRRSRDRPPSRPRMSSSPPAPSSTSGPADYQTTWTVIEGALRRYTMLGSVFKNKYGNNDFSFLLVALLRCAMVEVTNTVAIESL